MNEEKNRASLEFHTVSALSDLFRVQARNFSHHPLTQKSLLSSIRISSPRIVFKRGMGIVSCTRCAMLSDEESTFQQYVLASRAGMCENKYIRKIDKRYPLPQMPSRGTRNCDKVPPFCGQKCTWRSEVCTFEKERRLLPTVKRVSSLPAGFRFSVHTIILKWLKITTLKVFQWHSWEVNQRGG